jgi:Rad3-related DNA helicase
MSSLDTHTLLQEFAILQNIPDSLERSQRLEYLETQLHILNLQQRTKNTISKMSTSFLETNQTIRRMECFLESQVKHALITAPTQVGKTAAVLDFIHECIARNIGVIVSSDNKTDQQEQIMERLRKGLCLAHCKIIKVQQSIKKFTKDLETAFKNNLTPVLFCLDNATQIIKIHNNLVNMIIRNNAQTTNFSFQKHSALFMTRAMLLHVVRTRITI